MVFIFGTSQKAFLCPPIPGRADYIHGIADLIFDQKNASTSAEKPVFDGVTGLDIGTGANLIYPILGSQIYDWKFVATDIDKVAIKSAGIIQQANKALTNKIHLRHQQNPAAIFTGVIKQQDQFMFSMCNPPFHLSEQAAASGSQRKIQNLHKHQKKHNSIPATLKNNRTQNDKHILNFSGQHNELWCEGGEVGFISRMITQSTEYKHQVKWFTSLVSKKDSLIPISKALSAINPLEVKVVEMGQGNKLSRFVAWRFC